MDSDAINLKAIAAIPPWDWPENAKDTVANVLRNPHSDAEDRLLAAGLAGDMVLIDDELAELLLEGLHDSTESEEFRIRAAVALGPVLETAYMHGFDDPDDVPISETMFLRIAASLRTLYADAELPKEFRRRLLEAAVRAPTEWHQDAVRSAYYSSDPEWKLTAVFAMQWVPGFDEEIVEALESEDEGIQREAIYAAGSREIDAAWPHVAYVLEAEFENKELLLAAIEAAPYIRPREAIGLLVELVDSDDEDVADAAEEAMFMADLASGVDLDDPDAEDIGW